jgi:hypothetical protein
VSNYEAALKAEAKLVVRCWQRHTWEQWAVQASASLKYRAPEGCFYYVHPALPNKAFPKRKLAAEAAVGLRT